MKQLFCLLTFLCLYLYDSQAQSYRVSGLVVDKITKAPIVAAIVNAKHNNKAVITGRKGDFSFELDEDDILVVTHQDYKAITHPLKLGIGPQAITIQMGKEPKVKAIIPKTKSTNTWHIGDLLPGLVFPNTLNHEGKPLSTAELMGRPFVLDFFATWCGACSIAMEKLLPMEHRYNGGFQVVLVNAKHSKENKTKVENLYVRLGKKLDRPIAPLTILDDEILDGLFPHKSIPHYVWIDAHGRVTAITGSDAITENNIKAFVAGNEIEYELKDDMAAIDASFPMVDLVSKLERPTSFSNNFFSRYIPNINPSIGTSKDSLQKQWFAVNQPVSEIYKLVSGFTRNKIQFLATRFEDYYLKGNDHTVPWKNSNLFCYESSYPTAGNDSVGRAWMIADLDRYLSLDAHVEKKSVPCWVILDSSSASVDTAGLKCLPSQLAIMFNLLSGTDSSPDNAIVVDGTQAMSSIKIGVPRGSWASLEGLRKALAKNGLRLVLDNREIEMLVVEDAVSNYRTTKNNNQ